MPGWDDDELPTEQYLESVELSRELREISHKMRKEYKQKHVQMILRTTVCFKDIGKFYIGNQEEKSLYGDNYSGNHVAIFEC